MVKLKEFSLALGVINNILICDRQNRILFAGDDALKRLFTLNDSQGMNTSLMENIPDPEERAELMAKIEEVRRNKNTCYFKFKNQSCNLFIFPANYQCGENIILAIEDQILHANNIEFELTERVKELGCLYGISNELESTRNLEKALKNSLNILAKGFQYPELLASSIILDDKFYGDIPYTSDPSRDIIREDLVVNDKVRGNITVCYKMKERFLNEEYKLLREVALMLSRAIDKEEIRKNLESQQALLVSKNTELTQLTEDLKRMNNNLEAFLKAMTDTLVVIDSDFNITLSNKEEIGTSGKCYQKIFNSDTVCDNCPAEFSFRDGRPSSMEKKHLNRFYSVQSYPILDGKNSRPATVLEICSDVSEAEHIKNQLIQSYKLASLGKLVAGVAHEINNPNTFIRGNIKIVDEAFRDILPFLDRLYDANKELKIARLNYELFREHIPVLLEDMMGGANRIKKIVDGLRNFAKKDEGLLTDDVDLNSLIQNNLRITEKEVRKHARMVVNLDPTLPIFKGNSQKMEQVLMNLLINASQAIEREDGLIIVETGVEKNHKNIVLKITDNGKGMDENTRKHIFDPFFTTKRDKGGTGLGLSITYGIIQEHHGKILADSQINVGTTFTITIPLEIPTQNQEKP
ncbi:MAG: ATP-binding protein [Candidatus Omnitrophota bacterium]